jgi:hypothetical protein
MFGRFIYRWLGIFLKRFDRRKTASKILLQDVFDFGIRNAQIVNSWSILFACDLRPDDPIAAQMDTAYVDSIPNRIDSITKPLGHPPTVYIQSKWLIHFSRVVLPQIQRPFILVSGDNDTAINRGTLGSDLDLILRHPNLVEWYAQNKDHESLKLTAIPIGINLYNLWLDPLQWGGGFILPTLQELQIQTIAKQAQKREDRLPLIFCNWHFSIDRADRQACYDTIDRSLCYFQSKPLPPAKTWEEQSRYQFVLSPHGAGIDCFRTWEALLLGCIPIVKKSHISELFHDLPVIEVQSWTQLTPAFLAEAKLNLKNKVFNYDKLTMHYWRKLINEGGDL